jgi:thiamine biosynthesis lipoprotein
MERYKGKKTIVILLLILMLALAGCQGKTTDPVTTPTEPKPPVESSEPVEKSEFILGTIVSLKLYGNTSEALFVDSFEDLKSIERRMTINVENSAESEVIKINENAGIAPVKVSDDTFKVIQSGLKYSELSEGKFDLSIGVIVKLWNIGTDFAAIPPDSDIKARLPLVNYKLIELDEAEKTVFLKEKGMVIDLGGIAKGFGADVVAKSLTANGVKSAIVNLGGNVLALGEKPDGSPWRIGVQSPFSERGEYLGIATVKNKTIVTSGVYERYFEENGKRYHHIIDTANGYPVENNLVGVSIIADVSMDADALSTSVFSLGVEKGMALIESLDGIDAIFVLADKSLVMTDGAKSVFELTDSNFKIVE